LRTDRLTEEQFASIARVLSDPRRFGMLKEIAASGEPLACCALAAAQKISAATISHHVKELEGAGLIDVVRDGRFARLVFRRDIYDAYLRRLADI
jgi:ArsR family transcriptional regulator, arsenate/arsenite/antimonite-responsive transcriptional repressor